MVTPLEADVVVVGGGIAGLWLLAELRAAGYSVLLCERGALGGEQSVASQGIIHGGTKYALAGVMNSAARAIGAMPARWQLALDGCGSVDLSAARISAPHQYLWSTSALGSRLSAFFAGRVMRGRIRHQPVMGGPPTFRNPEFDGTLYRLEEPVVDVRSVLEVFRGRYASQMLRLEVQADSVSECPDGSLSLSGRLDDGTVVGMKARCLVATAGTGNEAFVRCAGVVDTAPQRRPLGMILARGHLPEMYAHCLGVGNLPRLTITSHTDASNRPVWYIGGAVAERGAGQAHDERVAEARREVETVLPWLDWAGVEWSSIDIDRGEPATAGGGRPDGCVVAGEGSVMVAWPTKLALAPALADRVLANLRRRDLQPGPADPSGRHAIPTPEIADFPWDEELQWS